MTRIQITPPEAALVAIEVSKMRFDDALACQRPMTEGVQLAREWPAHQHPSQALRTWSDRKNSAMLHLQ